MSKPKWISTREERPLVMVGDRVVCVIPEFDGKWNDRIIVLTAKENGWIDPTGGDFTIDDAYFWILEKDLLPDRKATTQDTKPAPSQPQCTELKLPEKKFYAGGYFEQGDPTKLRIHCIQKTKLQAIQFTCFSGEPADWRVVVGLQAVSIERVEDL